MSGVDGVLFDWGGTLTPWHTIDLVEQWRAYAAVYDPANADDLARALRDEEVEAWRRAEQHQRSGTLDDLLARAGVRTGSDRHGAAMRAYLDFWTPHTYLDEDVPELLMSLRGLGIRIGVLSNTLWPREHHEEVFARDGVLDLIDGAVYSSEIPYTKPHPEAFRAAMAAVGVPDPARVVFVGDRLFDDISGAKAVGMRAVLVPHSAVPAHDVEPDATIQRLADLLPLVESWRDDGGPQAPGNGTVEG
ncbi:MAG: HAD family hydrolase [Actinomycetota bacterium]|nr:HAD family hydrolase [Actinomycetota bacterium]